MPATSEINQLNSLLRNIPCDERFPLLVLLTGASGAGKTHLVQALETLLDSERTHVAYFDRIGVPTPEEMIRDYDSIEKWQKAKTCEWITQLSKMTDKVLVILEGQYNPKFAIEGCLLAGVKNYILAVVHCEESVRENRLKVLRNQSHLVNQDMRNWAKFLHRKTRELGGTVIDTSTSNLAQNMVEVVRLIHQKLAAV